MKKYLLILLAAVICASSTGFVCAKTTTNASLASAIKLYKAKNYTQSYITLNDIVKKDPSNAVAYYYLAMSAAQIGKKDEAIANYEKVITLAPDSQVGRFANKGKTCLETPDKCGETTEASDLEEFIQSRFGSGLSEEVRSEYEKQKIENLMREINRKNEVDSHKFKDYKDFSSEAPTNDEIVSALRVLQKAGLSDILGNSSRFNEMSLFTNGSGQNNSNAMLNMLMGSNNSSMSPEVIQALLTNQLTTGF